MNKKYAFLFIAVIFIVPTVLLAQENQPPTVTPVNARLSPPTTTFTVQASDPDGDTLGYAWSGEVSCGFFMAEGTTARWDHPHGIGEGMCPERSTSHPGEIYVIVSDNNGGTVRCRYSGSESGTGPKCEIVNSDGYFPSGPNFLEMIWYQICYWLWLPLLIGGIWLVSWLWTNGLFVVGKAKGPCEKEKADEAAAKARMDSAKSDFDDIDRAKQSADEAERKARDAESTAERLRRAAGTRWSASGSTDWEGEHREVHNEGWHDKEAGAKADAATAEARSAREAADRAKSDFDAKGGSSAHAQAKREYEEAKKGWEKANNALNICLGELNKPKSEPTPPTQPGGQPTTTPPPITPPPTTSPPTGPVINQPPRTEARVCINGERRNERSQSITARILDLESIKLMQDRIYSDAGNEAMKFVDYLQTLKDLFNLGKKIKGGISGYMEGSLTGGADAVGLPDFYEWYDKGIDALTRSMHELHELILDKQRLGEYWLTYQYKNITLTCRSYEVCHNNGWVRRCELTVEDNGMASGRTDPQSVHDIRELRPATTRLFTQLRTRFTPDKNRIKEFSDSCNRCQ